MRIPTPKEPTTQKHIQIPLSTDNLIRKYRINLSKLVRNVIQQRYGEKTTEASLLKIQKQELVQRLNEITEEEKRLSEENRMNAITLKTINSRLRELGFEDEE